MKRYKNKFIRYNRKKYEITWISEFAYHIMLRYDDPTHQINHVQIEKLLTESVFKNKKNDIYYGIGKFGNKIYETIVFLKNSRCIVKTSYLCNKADLIKYYYENISEK